MMKHVSSEPPASAADGKPACCTPHHMGISPRPGTVKEAILGVLLAGKTLTPSQAWSRFGASRLASTVHQLRAAGWPIASKAVVVRCADGRAATVAEYSLGGL
jgi:hypothetical protein